MKRVKVISYILAAMSGMCFIEGLAVLTRGRGTAKNGSHEKDRINA